MACGVNNILEAALKLQKEHGYVTEADVKAIAESVNRPVNAVYETLSFYSMILLKAPSVVRIEVCRGTSCYIKGGVDLLKELEQLTGCKPGETSEDGRYQVEYCECLGRCDTAPNIVVNGKLYTSISSEKLEEILKEVSN
ncbi:MAG: NAD(P)H-dependent oxidoreductase subunit E [Solobacterium sp.]|nr:NAD(P)H-dependent oxidoreductase subunit E [Solobacterium sp.]